jgi:hypothetical protein
MLFATFSGCKKQNSLKESIYLITTPEWQNTNKTAPGKLILSSTLTRPLTNLGNYSS